MRLRQGCARACGGERHTPLHQARRKNGMGCMPPAAQLHPKAYMPEAVRWSSRLAAMLFMTSNGCAPCPAAPRQVRRGVQDAVSPGSVSACGSGFHHPPP